MRPRPRTSALSALAHVSCPALPVIMMALGLLLGLGVPAAAQQKYGTPGAPMIRPHQPLRCEQCHLPQGDAPAQKCLQCHTALSQRISAGRGLHAAQKVRETACGLCHKDHRGEEVTEAYLGWRGVGGKDAFEHALTGFPLTRKHAGRPCADCHDRVNEAGLPRFPDASKSCAPCHADVHGGQLQNDCRRCHGAEEWKVRQSFDHNRESAYKLAGKHQALAQSYRCQNCHPGWRLRFKPTPSRCADAQCHQRDDVHMGAYGSSCDECHKGFEGFKKDLQDAGTGHAISPQVFGGAHDIVSKTQGCGACHNGRRLKGMGSLCITCHQRDDIHHNTLGPRCNDCHTQRSFAGGRFRHDTVGCTLRGVHRVLPCVDCHKGGNYAGLSPMCISCHRDDAMRAAGLLVRPPGVPESVAVPELHALQTACTHCHNTLSFRLGAGTRQSPPESVCQ